VFRRAEAVSAASKSGWRRGAACHHLRPPALPTGLGTLCGRLTASIGESVAASVFGIFAGFWLSYAALVLGLTHGWYGITTVDATATVELYLIAWLVVIVLLTLGTLRLPFAFTLLFVLIDLPLLATLLGTVNTAVTLRHVGQRGLRLRGRRRLPVPRRVLAEDRRHRVAGAPCPPCPRQGRAVIREVVVSNNVPRPVEVAVASHAGTIPYPRILR